MINLIFTDGLLVIVEYCRFGNLHSFLLRGRDSFIDQLNRSKDAFDFGIGGNTENDFNDGFHCR